MPSVNPIIPGQVSAASGFTMPTGLTLKKVVQLNGTTAVDIFGATNQFAGTLKGVKVHSNNDLVANVTVAGTGISPSIVIAKGSAGAVKGSAITAVAFTVAGTLTAVSNVATDGSLVEVDFSV